MAITPIGYANLKVTLAISGVPREMTSTFGLHIIDPSDSGQTAVNAFWGSLVSAGRPFHSDSMFTNTTAIGVSGIYVTDEGDIPVASSDSPSVGSMSLDSTQIAAVNSCVLVRKLTPFAGRKNRGRNYWPAIWFGEHQIDTAGNINPSILSVLQAKWDSTVGDWAADTDTYIPVLLHADGTTSPGLPRVITDLATQGTIATQRRRIR